MSYQRSFRLQIQIRQLAVFESNNIFHSNTESPLSSTAGTQGQVSNRYGPSDLIHQFIILTPGTITLGALKSHILEKYEKLYNSKQKESPILQLRDKNNYDLDDDYLVYEVFSSEDLIHVIMDFPRHNKRSSSKKKTIEQPLKHQDEENVRKPENIPSIDIPTPACPSPVLQPELFNISVQPDTCTKKESIRKSNSRQQTATVIATKVTISNDTQPITSSNQSDIISATNETSQVPDTALLISPKKNRSKKQKVTDDAAISLALESSNQGLLEVDGFRESFNDSYDTTSNPIVNPEINNKKTKERKRPLSSVPSIKSMIIESPVTALPQVVSTLTKQSMPQNENSILNNSSTLFPSTKDVDAENEYSSKLFSK